MAFSLVVETSAAGVSSPTTPGVDTTGAKLLLSGNSYDVGSSPSVVDNYGNTYNWLTIQVASFHNSRIAYAENPAVGTGHTFTLSGSPVYGSTIVQAWSGAAISGVFDQQGGAGTSSAVGSLGTGTITPTESDELIFSALGVGGPGATPPYTADNGFSVSAEQVPYTPGNYYGNAVASLVQSSAVSVSTTWSVAVGLVAMAATIASFKAAGGGGAIEEDVNLVTETDSVFGIGHIKSKAIGLVSETDTAQAIAHKKAKALGLVTETDSTLSIIVTTSNITISENTGADFTGVLDTKIRSGNPTTNYGTAEDGGAVFFGVGDYENSLIKFTGISNLSPNAIIASAKIRLNLLYTGAVEPSYQIGAYRILAPWDVNQATWEEASTGVAWGTDGAFGDGVDRVAAASAQLDIPDSAATGVYYEWEDTNLLADVQGMVWGDYSNYGWGFYKDGGTEWPDPAEDYRSFGFSEAVDGARPELVVTISGYMVGLVTETDSVQPMGRAKKKTLGLVTETDEAFSITPQGENEFVIGLVEETDTCLALARKKTRAIGLNTETDSAFNISPSFSRSLGLLVETDSTFAMGRKKTKEIGFPVETDSVLNLNASGGGGGGGTGDPFNMFGQNSSIFG